MDKYNEQSAEKNDNSPSQKIKRTKIMRLLVPVGLLIVIIVSLIVYTFYAEKNKRIEKEEAFTVNVSSRDFTYTYDDSDRVNVKTLLIPKYDFVDFTYTIIYYGKGLLNEYKEDIVVGSVKAGAKLERITKIADIERNIKGVYSYCAVLCKSGKKQYKNIENSSNIEYNKELDFDFTMKYTGEYRLSCTITNKSALQIKEIRNFVIELDFGEGITCRFSAPRIVFDHQLAPNAKITLTDLSGNKHIGLGANNAEEARKQQDKLRAGMDAVSYSKQTYQVIYIPA